MLIVHPPPGGYLLQRPGDASLAFDLHVAATSHTANEIVDHGPAIVGFVGLAAGRPLGLLDSVFAVKTVDIQ
jgi:hypothetical protein